MERDAIEARFRAIEARLDTLERRLGLAPPAKPVVSNWQKFDPTDHMSMPASATADLVKAVGTKALKDIHDDLRNPGKLR